MYETNCKKLLEFLSLNENKKNILFRIPAENKTELIDWGNLFSSLRSSNSIEYEKSYEENMEGMRERIDDVTQVKSPMKIVNITSFNIDSIQKVLNKIQNINSSGKILISDNNLSFNGKIKSLNNNTLPFWFISLLDENGTVDIPKLKLKKDIKGDKELAKAVQNFSTEIKKFFNLSDREIVGIDARKKKIIFNMKLFYFK
jgi:hypothetical protein